MNNELPAFIYDLERNTLTEELPNKPEKYDEWSHELSHLRLEKYGEDVNATCLEYHKARLNVREILCVQRCTTTQGWNNNAKMIEGKDFYYTVGSKIPGTNDYVVIASPLVNKNKGEIELTLEEVTEIYRKLPHAYNHYQQNHQMSIPYVVHVWNKTLDRKELLNSDRLVSRDIKELFFIVDRRDMKWKLKNQTIIIKPIKRQ